MAGTCFICCVLIPGLLITTVHGKPTEIALNCPNQNVTVGETLFLNCSVKCEKCTPIDCKWNKANDYICNIDPKTTESTSGSIFYFSCTLFNASKEHNGTFKFWIQTTIGVNETKFNVTIVPRTGYHTDTSQQDPLPILQDPSEKQTDGRSATVAVAVMIMFFVVIGIMVALFLRKNCNNMPISENLSHELMQLT